MTLSPYPPELVRYPVMHQTWVNLTFLHWSYQPSVIRGLLPKRLGLKVDPWQGKAWVGLVPFFIKDLRLPMLPPVPWISNFPETNVRTYVIGPDGQPGVWFFSLDAARLPAVIEARLSYGLPYMWAKMRVSRERNRIRYFSRRMPPESPKIGARIEVQVNETIPLSRQTDFDLYLVARYRLYASLFGRLIHANVAHKPYPLARATVLHLEQTLLAAAGIPEPEGDPVVHFSPGVDVRIGRPRLLRQS